MMPITVSTGKVQQQLNYNINRMKKLIVLGALFNLVACGEASHKEVVVKEEVKIINGDTSIIRTTEAVDAENLEAGKQEKEVKIRIVGPKEFDEIAANEKGHVIDVRTAGEFDAGHVQGAENKDITNGAFQAAMETMDKAETIMVYCKSGGRSSRARQMLEKSGFENIVELDGGYMNYLRVKEANSNQ